MGGEADLVRRFADDLDAESGGMGDTVTGVASIGEGEFDERPATARCAQ